jgi:hypothetical protein
MAQSKHDFILDQSVDVRKTEAIEVPDWARTGAVYIPAIVDGAVTMEFMAKSLATAATLLPSNDTGWATVRVPIVEGSVLVTVLGSALDPGWIVITEFVRGLKQGFIRFSVAADQVADSAWILVFSD